MFDTDSSNGAWINDWIDITTDQSMRIYGSVKYMSTLYEVIYINPLKKRTFLWQYPYSYLFKRHDAVCRFIF